MPSKLPGRIRYMLNTQDISIIKGLFEENNAILENRFKEIDDRFDWLGQVLKSRFDAIDERFDEIEEKLDRKLDTEEAYGMFGSHNRRISKLEDDGLHIKRKFGI